MPFVNVKLRRVHARAEGGLSGTSRTPWLLSRVRRTGTWRTTADGQVNPTPRCLSGANTHGESSPVGLSEPNPRRGYPCTHAS